MKQLLLAVSLLALVAVLLAGCGKSEEMKQIEAAMNKEIMDKHDELMKSMGTLDELTAQIAEATKKHDELVKKFPKLAAGHDATDLVAAQEKITAAKAAMDNWMKGFKPFDMEAEHEVVISGMTTTKNTLLDMEKQFTGAIDAAKAAISAHAAAAETVAKKK